MFYPEIRLFSIKTETCLLVRIILERNHRFSAHNRHVLIYTINTPQHATPIANSVKYEYTLDYKISQDKKIIDWWVTVVFNTTRAKNGKFYNICKVSENLHFRTAVDVLYAPPHL